MFVICDLHWKALSSDHKFMLFCRDFKCFHAIRSSPVAVIRFTSCSLTSNSQIKQSNSNRTLLSSICECLHVASMWFWCDSASLTLQLHIRIHINSALRLLLFVFTANNIFSELQEIFGDRIGSFSFSLAAQKRLRFWWFYSFMWCFQASPQDQVAPAAFKNVQLGLIERFAGLLCGYWSVVSRFISAGWWSGV